MKKKEPRIATITLRDPKYTMSSIEYNIWRIKWDSFWKVVMENALEQIKEDKKNGIKYIHTRKADLVRS